ncbi:MAG: ATP-binding cassette, subfamily bacterial, partial [Candidatus Poribacteria bacterium]|nr:ATP-binding cassette, subfamily bacterial [Candidatus Poribacteria bacterium]
MNSSMPEGLSDLYPNTEIPAEINKKLKEILTPLEEIRISVSSDMNMDGAFEDCWLLGTDKRLFVFSSNHNKKPELLNEVSISDITEVTLKNFTGNGFLEVETNTKSIELLRFSKTAFYTNNISNLPQAIDHLREQNGQIIENKHRSDYRQSHRCEKCGNIIPFRRDTCPNCLKKRALLLRLFGYLKPYWALVVVSFI